MTSSIMLEELAFLITITLSGTIWLLVLDVYFILNASIQETWKLMDIWMRRTFLFFVLVNYWEIWYMDAVMFHWIAFNVFILAVIIGDWRPLHQERMMYMWWPFVFVLYIVFSIFFIQWLQIPPTVTTDEMLDFIIVL